MDDAQVSWPESGSASVIGSSPFFVRVMSDECGEFPLRSVAAALTRLYAAFHGEVEKHYDTGCGLRISALLAPAETIWASVDVEAPLVRHVDGMYLHVTSLEAASN